MTLMDGIRTRLDTVWGGENYAGYGLLDPGTSLVEMRNRSRRLEENNHLASGILDRCVENVIGTGITLRSTSSSKAWNEEVDAYWGDLVSGVRFDVRRRHTFGQMQRLAYRAVKRDGDVAIVLIDRGFGPELQIVEGHHIETPPERAGDPQVVDGIQFSPWGEIVAIWVREENAWGIPSWRPVQAQDVIFLVNHFRYSASRGLPSFHGGYTLFDQISGYLDAVVVAARIGASQALVAKRKAASALAKGGKVPDATGRMRRSVPIQPGNVNFVDDIDDIVAFNPTHPQVQFPDAIRAMARFCGLRFGLTIERVMLDFTKANYSVSRSTALQEQRTAELEQDWLYNSFLLRVRRWAVYKGIKTKRFKSPQPPDFLKHEWMPQGRPLVEASKDAPGLATLIQQNLESVQNVCAERGYDWRKIVSDKAELVRVLQENGLPTAQYFPPVAGSGQPAPASSDTPTTDPTEDPTDPTEDPGNSNGN